MIVFVWVQAEIFQELLHLIWASRFTLVYFIAESADWVLQTIETLHAAIWFKLHQEWTLETSSI